MPRVDVGGLSLHYEEAGAGRPLIFIHGMSSDHTLWQAQLAGLSDYSRVIAYDCRGYGESDKPGAGTFNHLVEDLEGLMGGLRIRKATLCGLSMGGAIAQGLALKKPGLVDGLILSDTFSHATEGLKALFKRMVETLKGEGGLEEMYKLSLKSLYTEAFTRSHPEVLDLRRRRTLMMDLSTVSALARDFSNLDLRPRLGGLKTPTLVLRGSLDVVTPKGQAQEMAGLIMGSRYAEIEGAGHLSCLEKPDEFNGHVRSFLRQNAT